ncbi:hypothetical protein [Gilvimarinus sp. DA14]|uniref:hypothetical protein n=1 Tax=Gilvimarinus sp. DA14 TaxID=2956798 RepID=UPI0020B703A9|nr:hypothetical protein [Gilvimarinus sp. DA14]UTF59170.1 hypothetical protein NHM04_11860 [Gilvimarinus sp. DA14]
MAHWKILLLFLAFIPSHALALTISNDKSWPALFGGKPTQYEISLLGLANAQVSIHWELSVKGRILSSGQGRADLDRDGLGVVQLTLAAPKLTPSAVVSGQLSVVVFEKGNPDSIAHKKIALNIYGQDVLWAERQALGSRRIQLFDPSQATVKAFQSLKLPYNQISKSQLLNAASPGLIVIGAGLALDDVRGLTPVLLELARTGQAVVILQPVSGTFPLYDSPDLTHMPTAMSLSDHFPLPLLRGLTWPELNSTLTYRLIPSYSDSGAEVEVKPETPTGWSWLQLDYSGSGGRLIVCAFPLIERIDESPVPQIVLARLLANENL